MSIKEITNEQASGTSLGGDHGTTDVGPLLSKINEIIRTSNEHAASSVSSVFTRSAAVVAVAGDYDASQVGNDSDVAGEFVDDALNTLKPTVTRVNAATYDLLDTDRVLHVDYTITAAVTNLRLMSAQCVDGRRIEIKDTGCEAGAKNITVTTEGAEKIITNSLPGSDTFVFGVNGEAYYFTARNGNWYVS